jgi:hypothetical protein
MTRNGVAEFVFALICLAVFALLIAGVWYVWLAQ